MSRSKVPGYREGLNVYQTFTCPRSDSEWTSASLRMNCHIGTDSLFNRYYCIPNAERSHFVEFCYDKSSMKTETGNCWELGGMGYLNQVDCSNFVKGCPDYTYLSERVYKFPACLDLNFSKRCFTEEPGCTVLKNSTKTLANNQSCADTPLHLGLVALISSVLTAIILLLVVYWVKRFGICPGRKENSKRTGDIKQEDDSSETHAFIQGKEESKKIHFKRSQSVVLADQDIKPHGIRGHISHLNLSNTSAIWASNDRGKLGLFDSSGNDKRSIETCSTYSGHFTIATFDNEELIYWVHNEKRLVKKEGKNGNKTVTETGDWEPISILFSAEEETFFVGKAMDNDAKITRYKKDWVKNNDIHKHKENGESRNLFQYPAYLAQNKNGDLCVSDNNRRVIVVDKDNKLRFKYTGSGQSGFTPYGVCTDSLERILIVDSGSMCIHIIDKDGKFQNKMKVYEHLREPRGLCIDKSGKCYVGTYGSILVYKYSSDDKPTTAAINESE